MNGSLASEELATALRRVLAENGISGNHDGLHGWRCAYPDRYGECSCVDELVSEIVACILHNATTAPQSED